MSSKYLLLVIPLLVVFAAVFFSICENCIKSCIIFTTKNADQCAKSCGVCSIADNRFTNWLNWWHNDDYSYMLTDDPVCKGNYAETPKIEEKKGISKSKPNIILFVLDDLDVNSPYWEAMPFAKELFKVNGTHYENGYTSTAFCCPARCQIFTGMYGHNNGVISSHGSYGSVNAFRKPLHLNGTRQMSNGKCINNENRTIPLLLQKYGGYKTAIFGKYLNGFENDLTNTVNYAPVGWDQFDITANNYHYIGNMYIMTEWDSVNKTMKYNWHGKQPTDYLTDVIATKSVKFINNQRKINTNNQRKRNSDPLFMYIAPTAPHFPQTSAERHMDRIKQWEDRFDEFVSSRPNYHSDESVKTKSSWLRDNADVRDGLLNMKVNNWYEKKTFNLHKIEFAKRMGTLYAVDEMIKSVYDKLKDLGETDNTIFGFVSDNGFNMGSHKLYHKMVPYDESVRIPFYLSGPQIRKNYVDSRLVLLNDLAPTFLDLANFKIPEHMDGMTLIKDVVKEVVTEVAKDVVTEVAKDIERSGILFEYGKFVQGKNEDFTGSLDRVSEYKMIAKIAPKFMGFDVPPYVALRTHDHLYVEYYDTFNSTNTEYELYDMQKDPYQIYNIYNSTSDSKIMKLREHLNRLSTCYGKDCIF